MFRFIIYLILTVLLISLLRGVIGLIAKFITGGASSGTPASGRGRAATTHPQGGTLRKCPVCGTFTSEAIAIKHIQAGSTLFYCSAECEKKAHAPS